MSGSRVQFLSSVSGIAEAINLENIASGSTQTRESNGVVILRRGIFVAALIALETFVRDRTAELLMQLGRWPGRFEDLPQGFRDAALLSALTNLQKYAAMLKRQKDNYEEEIIREIAKIASSKGPTYGFTRFVAGDFTGNISEEGFRSLLLTFQIEDCWRTFDVFSSDIGFGTPSVQQLLVDLVRKRHRSAHSAGFAPTATDINELSGRLFCLGICFDAAMTTSIEQALASWQLWSDRKLKWRDGVDLFLVDPAGSEQRIRRHGYKRALKIVKITENVTGMLPRSTPGRVGIVVFRNVAGLPKSWSML